MKEEKLTFMVTDDEGKEVECEILFTFEADQTKKNYIVYTDNTVDKDGNTKVYASVYDPADLEKENTKLQPIESDDEWKMIEDILAKLQQETDKGDEQ